MATLDELKAKLLAIIDEYKVVSKAKAKEFGIAEKAVVSAPLPRDKYFYIIEDSPAKKNANCDWVSRRTITYFSGKGSNRRINIYAEKLDVNGEPTPFEASDNIIRLDFPPDVKDAKDKNVKQLLAKVSNNKRSYSVELVWKAASPNKINPEPKKEEPDRATGIGLSELNAEYERRLEEAKRNRRFFPEPVLNTEIPFDVFFITAKAEIEDNQDFTKALLQIKFTLDLYKNDPKFKGLTVEIIVTTPMRAEDKTMDFPFALSYVQLLPMRVKTVRDALVMYRIPNANNIEIKQKFEYAGTQKFSYKYVLR